MKTRENLGDAIDAYLQKAAAFPLLTADEEMALAKMIELGDEKSLHSLVNHNLRLVVSFARFASWDYDSFADMLTEGAMGLFKAASMYDYRKGFRFSTYAVCWIRQHISRFAQYYKRRIRIPNGVSEEISRLARIVNSFEHDNFRKPTNTELAQVANLTEEIVTNLLMVDSATSNVSSLDDTLDNANTGNNLHEIVCNDHNDDLLDAAVDSCTKDEFNKLIESLTPRDAEVIKLRFGFEHGYPRTLDESGQILKVTRERVRQLEHHALNKIRASYVHRERLDRIRQLAGIEIDKDH